MQYSDTGIILRIGRFREADLWVRFLSPTRGIVTAFAFGGSRSRRRFSGCLDYLNEVHFTIRSSKMGAYTSLEEGVLLRSPVRLRTDPQRTGVLANCQKFLEGMGVSAEGADSAFALFSETMALLESATFVDPILPVLFRARLAFDQGYRPELGHCINCGDDLEAPDDVGVVEHLPFVGGYLSSEERGAYPRKDDMPQGRSVSQSERVAQQAVPAASSLAFGKAGARQSVTSNKDNGKPIHRFLVREGALFCGSCAFPEGPTFRVGKEALDAMRFVQDNSPLRWADLSLSDRARKEFSRAVDGFIQYHVGLVWEKGSFRRV